MEYKPKQNIPLLFQEIVINDDKRKKLIRNMLVPLKEYKELKDTRSRLRQTAAGIYGYYRPQSPTTKRKDDNDE